MKKAILCLFFILVTTLEAYAAEGGKLYITTIQECKVEQVQDVILDKMTSRNFIIVEVTPYKMVFQKNFQDGFGSMRNAVIFNVLARDGNVKLMTTEQCVVNNVSVVDRNITHIIPIIKEIRNAIDGTPIAMIENEAVNQLPNAGNKQEKKLGFKLSTKGIDGQYHIKTIDPGSAAADAKLAINDVVVEINGRTLSDYDKDAVEAYIANKWGAGSSLIMLISRDGDQKMISLKRD